MKEDIKELRRICQLPRRAHDTWYGTHVCRKVSIYITRAALRVGISADFVTLVFLLIGVVACIFFTLGTDTGFLIGIALLHLWYLVDHVDGEIARYRRQETVTGVYFDKIVHYLIHPSVFFSLGWGVYKDIGIQEAIIIGYIAGISGLMLTATEDLKDSSILQKLVHIKKDIVFDAGKTKGCTGTKNNGIAKRLFSMIHKVCTFPHDMNLLTLVVLLKWLVFDRLIYASLLFYAIFSTLAWSSRLILFVRGKRADTEIEGLSG